MILTHTHLPPGRTRIVWKAALLGTAMVFLASSSRADHVFVPVVANSGQELARLDTRISYPSGNGPFPVVLLLHGSSGGNPKNSDAWRFESKFLTDRGFAVVAFMRRGRGESSGLSSEGEERNCEDGAWAQGLTEALLDIDSVIRYAATLEKIDSENIVLWGVSRGGFLAVKYSAAGKHSDRIKKVINFVGGWVAQAEDQCEQDFNLIEFRKLGAQTKKPMLWLYGENDQFYGPKAPNEYFREFSAAGGRAELLLVADIPANGHWLPQYPDRWREEAAVFLSARKTEK